jgi:hypothetical protein
MEISHSKAREVWGQLQSAKARLKNMRQAGEESVGRTKQLAEGVGAAFVSGYLAGKNNGVMPLVFGYPLDMVAGLGGGVLAIMGVAGKYDEDLLNVAIGFGGTYAYREGLTVGAAAAKKATTTTTTSTTGAIPAGMYAGAVPAQQYAGAVPAQQYAGFAQPAGNYR